MSDIAYEVKPCLDCGGDDMRRCDCGRTEMFLRSQNSRITELEAENERLRGQIGLARHAMIVETETNEAYHHLYGAADLFRKVIETILLVFGYDSNPCQVEIHRLF